MSPPPSVGESLLKGPRGRRFLMEYARECERVRNPIRSDETLGYAVTVAANRREPGKRYRRPLFGARDVGQERAEVSPADVAERLGALVLLEPTPELLRAALSAAVGNARYWQAPDGEDNLARASEVSLALRRVAHHVADSPLTEWWGTPAVLSAQHSVHGDGAPAAVAPDDVRAVLRAAQEHEQAAARTARTRRPIGRGVARSGEWWSTPPHATPSSTRPLADGSPVGLWLVEDDLGWERAESVKLVVPEHAVVFEIAEAENWVDLCRRFPLEVTAQKRDDWFRATGHNVRWVIPDWAQVAEHYDGVHLHVGAYLSAAGVAIFLDGTEEVASVIAGWNPDQTYWFSPDVIYDDERTRWVLDEDGADTVWRSASL